MQRDAAAQEEPSDEKRVLRRATCSLLIAVSRRTTANTLETGDVAGGVPFSLRRKHTAGLPAMPQPIRSKIGK